MDQGKKRSFEQIEDSAADVYEQIEDLAADVYEQIEDSAAGYEQMEDSAADGYKKVEDSAADVYEFSPNEHLLLEKWSVNRPMFMGEPHYCLEIDAKSAALEVSPSIVGLVSFSGEFVLSQASGTIIETEQNQNIVMTSLHLIRGSTELEAEFAENTLSADLKIVVRASDDNTYLGKIHIHDFHYNLLIITFKSKAPLPCAKLRLLDDDHKFGNPQKSFEIRPHKLKLKSGDPVAVVGKYFYKDYNFMAASGVFRMKRCELTEYDCRELLSATCRFTIAGDGGPLIDLAGQVIGIAFYEIGPIRPVLPMNIAYKWWNHYKLTMELRHPNYGFEASNMYVADIYILEKLVKKFQISNGVLVEKVLLGSHAQSAGLREDDVILKCDGKAVGGFLELWDLMWEKVGQTVDLEVARVDVDFLQILTMVVGEATPNELNNWPHFHIPNATL